MIKPGTLFRTKTEFWGSANMDPDEIFMYLETKKWYFGTSKEHPFLKEHQFLTGDGRIIFWIRSEGIEKFVEHMVKKDYFERIEI